MLTEKLLASGLAAAVLGVIAALSVWTQDPWLAPSLGSAAFAQLLSPEHSSARPYSVAVGQLIGVAAGFIGVFAAAATTAPAFMGGHHLVGARAVAVVIAAFVAALAQLLTSATTPAGGATALVVALGAEAATVDGAIRLVVGIALVTALGEAGRYLLLWLRKRQNGESGIL